MWQTEKIVSMLAEKGVLCEIIRIETAGDKKLDTSIAGIGSKGVFTDELEQLLEEGGIDIAVHSAKDLPSVLADDFELIAFTEREKVNDVLVAERRNIDLENTSDTLRIGTSSVRRTAFLQHYYPHVEVVAIRGNLQTRIARMHSGLCDALMLAYAGVRRMGYQESIVHEFPETSFIPPAGQGCIAVEAAKSLSAEKKMVIRSTVNSVTAEYCLLAERAFLARLEGGCSIPAFVLARLENGNLLLLGGLASLDGREILCRKVSGLPEDAVTLGAGLGDEVLRAGGAAMLKDIRRQQM